MVYNTQGLLCFRPLYGIPKNTTLRKLDLLPFFAISSKEIDPISETLCSIWFRTMDEIPKRINPKLVIFHTKMEAARLSEMFASIYKATRCHIQEDNNLLATICWWGITKCMLRRRKHTTLGKIQFLLSQWFQKWAAQPRGEGINGVL